MALRPAALLVLAIVVAAVGVGCGSGGDDEATASQALAWPQFVKQANAICSKQRVGLSKRAAAWLAHDRAHGFPHDILLWRLAHYVLLPTIENEMLKVLSLDPPSVDKAGVDAALSAESVAIDKVSTASELASMTAFHNYFAESAAELRADELTACTNY
jgi:hypothetical protein